MASPSPALSVSLPEIEALDSGDAHCVAVTAVLQPRALRGEVVALGRVRAFADDEVVSSIAVDARSLAIREGPVALVDRHRVATACGMDDDPVELRALEAEVGIAANRDLEPRRVPGLQPERDPVVPRRAKHDELAAVDVGLDLRLLVLLLCLLRWLAHCAVGRAGRIGEEEQKGRECGHDNECPPTVSAVFAPVCDEVE
jgi:hypothetical protein